MVTVTGREWKNLGTGACPEAVDKLFYSVRASVNAQICASLMHYSLK